MLCVVPRTNRLDGPAIDRHIVDVGLGPRAIDHGLVIAGDETLALAEPRDAQGQKILLEERLRAGAVGQFEAFGDAAGFAQRRAQRLRLGRRRGLGGDRLAAGAKRLVGGEMIVVVPAGDIRPGQRRILAAADLQRPFEVRIWQGARGRLTRMCVTDATWRGRKRTQRYAAATATAITANAQPCKAARVSERFRCQPASSSDRERSCRGRMSRHR